MGYPAGKGSEDFPRRVIPRRVAVGRVARLHGLKGSVEVLPYADDLTKHLAMEELFLEPEGGRALVPEEVRRKQTRLIMHFRDVNTPEKARDLVTRELWAETGVFAPLPAGDYYWFQIEGLEVFTEQGKSLGVVREIMATGSNDVFVVRGKTGEVLLPATREFIRKIDLETATMTIRVVPGLLEHDED